MTITHGKHMVLLSSWPPKFVRSSRRSRANYMSLNTFQGSDPDHAILTTPILSSLQARAFDPYTPGMQPQLHCNIWSGPLVFIEILLTQELMSTISSDQNLHYCYQSINGTSLKEPSPVPRHTWLSFPSMSCSLILVTTKLRSKITLQNSKTTSHPLPSC